VVEARKVDITAPGVRTVLNLFVESESSPAETAPEIELLVKFSAPIYIQVIPPPIPLSNPAHPYPNPFSSSSGRTTSEFVENFMSTWTRLVGDPVLSKCIIMVLAVSVSLNGYLLKGIAAGLAGKGVLGKEGVRFVAGTPVGEGGAKAEAWSGAGAEDPITEPKPMDVVAAPRSTVAPVPTRVPKFMLEDLDQRLKAQGLTIRTPSSSCSSDGETLASVDSDTGGMLEPEKVVQVRSLTECVDIFENGPRPVSVALPLLNDEEIVLLAQSGKIAAYALEKLLDDGSLDNVKLERAVRIRRALICE
jgi:hydroxymethylglutaryl-CoA reductase (NADPH)